MKTNIRNLFLLPALLVGLGLIPAGRATAQTFTTLYSFTAAPAPGYTNSDGAHPFARSITNSSGNTLYGTAHSGGSSGYGSVFTVNIDGTGFTNLHRFTAISGLNTNSDGAYPYAGVLLSGNTLYGTASLGGISGNGTVFAVNTDGTGFTNLHSFTANSDGAQPEATLILSGETLYGTAINGGSSGVGTVFAVNTNGTGFTTLHSFTAAPCCPQTNSDGAGPWCELVLSGNMLYGTAYAGGTSGNGTVFALNTNGTGFTTLHSFTAAPCCPNANSDGANPGAGLLLSGNLLYGTTVSGGSSGGGTVFALNTNGTGFTNLHSFTQNSDGSYLRAGLILSGNTVYGTALQGGSSGNGTMFALNTDGTGLTNLHNFTDGSDGGSPIGGLILSGTTLYGTAERGGSSGNGTVFSLSFRPQLTITASGTNVILSWPTSAAGFSYVGYILQETANLGSPDAWVPSSLYPPVISNGQIRLTGPMLGPRRFYRLAH